MGRRRKTDEERLTKPIWTRLTEEEIEILRQISKEEKRPVANMLRVIVTKALEERAKG